MPKYRLEGMEIWLYEVTADSEEQAIQEAHENPYKYRDALVDTQNIRLVEVIDA